MSFHLAVVSGALAVIRAFHRTVLAKPVIPAVAVLALLLSGCRANGTISIGPAVIGSGNLVTREMGFSGFTGVELGNAATFEIVQSESHKVSITADDNLFEYVDVTTAGETLVVRLKPGRSYNRTTLKARIAMPNLGKARLSGAASGTVTGFRSSGNLDLDLSGASQLSGSLDAGATWIEATGASRVTLDGSAGNLNIDLSGASRADLARFVVDSARVDFSGASQGTLNVKGRLDGDLSGASGLNYSGGATVVKVETSGASWVRGR